MFQNIPKNKIIHGAIGSAVAVSFLLNSMITKPELETMSPEWMAATKDYRKFQNMDNVYSDT